MESIIIESVQWLIHHNIASDSHTITGQITLLHGDKRAVDLALGVGPIDAIFKAIEKILKKWDLPVKEIILKNYSVRKGVGSSEAKGITTVNISSNGLATDATVENHDINFAATVAIIECVNVLLRMFSIKKELALT